MQSRILLIGACLVTCVCCFAAGTVVWSWAESAEGQQRRRSLVAASLGAVAHVSDETAVEVAPEPPFPPVFGATPSLANDPSHDDPYWRLFNLSLTNGEMADEAIRAVSMAEADLEKVLVRLRAMVKGSGPRAILARMLLEQSQRSWAAYMEAQIDMEFPSPANMRYGSVSFWTIPLRRAGMIQDRVKELKYVLGDGEEEGDVSRPAWPDCHED